MVATRVGGPSWIVNRTRTHRRCAIGDRGIDRRRGDSRASSRECGCAGHRAATHRDRGRIAGRSTETSTRRRTAERTPRQWDSVVEMLARYRRPGSRGLRGLRSCLDFRAGAAARRPPTGRRRRSWSVMSCRLVSCAWPTPGAPASVTDATETSRTDPAAMSRRGRHDPPAREAGEAHRGAADGRRGAACRRRALHNPLSRASLLVVAAMRLMSHSIADCGGICCSPRRSV